MRGRPDQPQSVTLEMRSGDDESRRVHRLGVQTRQPGSANGLVKTARVVERACPDERWMLSRPGGHRGDEHQGKQQRPNHLCDSVHGHNRHPSVLEQKCVTNSPGGASPLAALLLPQIQAEYSPLSPFERASWPVVKTAVTMWTRSRVLPFNILIRSRIAVQWCNRSSFHARSTPSRGP